MDGISVNLDSIPDGLGDELRIAGTKKVPMVTCTIEGELSEGDIVEYLQASGENPSAQKSGEKDIACLRAKHHQVARLLAAGLPEGVVAELSGFTAPYISTLKQTPSMLELINHYRGPGNQAVQQMTERLRLLAHMSVDQLIAKAEAGELNAQELLAATKLGADRSGNGPMQKVEHDHVHSLDEKQVARLAASAREQNASRIINIEDVRKQLPKPEADDA